MRFMVLVKADADSESGALPDERLLNEMGMFNAEMEKAGILLAGEGLLPSAKGARVTVTDDKRVVTDGPFAETKELIAGFWILQVESLEEAVGWVRRAPNPRPGSKAEFEVRQVAEVDDFGDAFTPEARAAEEHMRARLADPR